VQKVHFPHGSIEIPFIVAAGPYPVRKPLRKTTCGFSRHLIAFRTMDTHQLHRVGYARVSSAGQNLDSQIDALKAAGCKKIFTDKITGSRMDRPGWDQLMEYVRPGDVLVVAELSRMTRSLMHLLETAQALECKQVNLVSLRENIDTSTATGRCFLSMMGAIHQMERKSRAERAAAGRPSAKARGKTGGQPLRCRQAARCQSALRQLRQDGGRGLQGRWRWQTHLLRLPGSTERSGFSSSHHQLDLFEGLGKNSRFGTRHATL
jgi:DNA invertase Pin-like site-specific DNA recombinase